MSLSNGNNLSSRERNLLDLQSERGFKGMKKKKIEKKKPIEPNGSITPQKDWFKPMENIGTFPKPKVERKDNNKWKGV